MASIRAAILVNSDRAYSGERADSSGPALAAWLEERSVEVAAIRLLPDDAEAISATLIEWTGQGQDQLQYDLILTTGGTGVAPRDITPEATRKVLEREIPGIGEAMRAASLSKTPFAMLSRAIAGTRGRTLIVNLPGSPKGAIENLEAVWTAIPHALKKIQGDTQDCVPPESPSPALPSPKSPSL